MLESPPSVGLSSLLSFSYFHPRLRPVLALYLLCSSSLRFHNLLGLAAINILAQNSGSRTVALTLFSVSEPSSCTLDPNLVPRCLGLCLSFLLLPTSCPIPSYLVFEVGALWHQNMNVYVPSYCLSPDSKCTPSQWPHVCPGLSSHGCLPLGSPNAILWSNTFI